MTRRFGAPSVRTPARGDWRRCVEAIPKSLFQSAQEAHRSEGSRAPAELGPAATAGRRPAGIVRHASRAATPWRRRRRPCTVSGIAACGRGDSRAGTSRRWSRSGDVRACRTGRRGTGWRTCAGGPGRSTRRASFEGQRELRDRVAPPAVGPGSGWAHRARQLAVDSMNVVYTGDPGHGWPIAQAAMVPVLIVVG